VFDKNRSWAVGEAIGRFLDKLEGVPA